VEPEDSVKTSIKHLPQCTIIPSVSGFLTRSEYRWDISYHKKTVDG